jgi:hypothetical protein
LVGWSLILLFSGKINNLHQDIELFGSMTNNQYHHYSDRYSIKKKAKKKQKQK